LQSSEVDELVRIGELLDGNSVLALEKQLLLKPDALALRVQLLAFYSMHSEKIRAYVDHVKYFIEKYGADEKFAEFAIYRSASSKYLNREAYEEIKAAWFHQLHLPGSSILTAMNAANFFSVNNEPDLAVAALKSHPDLTRNPDALYQIASLLKLIANRSGSEEKIKEALDYYEQALGLAPNHTSKVLIRIEIALIAFDLADFMKVREHAEKALELAEQSQADDVYGYAVHRCNVILGRLTLAKNDIPTSMDHLLKAAAPQPSALLAISGPDLSLAKLLLSNGYYDAVVEFLTGLSKFEFSETHQKKLTRMIKTITWP